jgi:phosphate ABC transporter phosphate-binding protein
VIARPRIATHGAAIIVLAVVAAWVSVAAPAADAETYKRVSGSGSTWSANAIQQWVANVQQYGMRVDYSDVGSSVGRQQYANGTVDFAVSEIPFGVRDGASQESIPRRKFAYMPIVAGGTSFMYNLTVGGKRVTNLRLSGDTLSKIFTGAITAWNAPAIKADNPALQLPAKRIVPVVRSDGSGTTAQFTAWISTQHAGVYGTFCAKVRRSPCTQTSNFPVPSGSSFVSKAGSNGVAGFVRQPQSDGAITYVEYSYAKNAGFPVVKVLNRAGYYTAPTAQNVAVGLLGAGIETANTNPAAYLTQKLAGVYNNADPRTYPLSSYSYMIIPTAVEGTFTAEKGKTLGAFAYYFLCAGQQQADVLGYSPLPINLVKAGLSQVRRIPGVNVQSIDVAKCNNPTFSASGGNTLAKSAPMPAACDKKGAAQCGTGAQAATAVTSTGGSSTKGGTTTNGTTAGSTTGTTTGPVTAPGGSAPGSSTAAAPGAVSADGTAVVAADGTTLAAGAAATPVSLAEPDGWRMEHTLMALTALTLLLATAVPALIIARTRR